jgi:hypothetical protein
VQTSYAGSNHSHGNPTLNLTGLSGTTASNSAGLTLSLSADTSYAASNHSHGNPTLFLTNISGTTASNSAGLTLSLSVGAGGAGDGVNIVAAGTRTATISGTVLFSDLNGVSFGLNAVNGSVMTASHNALTSQSNQNVTAQNGGFAFQTLSLSNANGISFGTSAGSAITASHNAITTARASTDAIGLNTAQTNVTWTVNSSGLSLNASGYGGTTTAITGAASITKNSAGFQFNGAGLAGTSSGFTGANVSASITHNTAGLAMSMSVEATTSLSATGAVSLSANGATLSIGVPQFSFYASSNTTAQSSSSSFSHGSLTFRGAGGVSVGFSGSEVVISGGAGAAPAASAANGSFSFNTLSFSNLNGISFGTSAGSAITASHNAITTARASTDAIGLNTAQTNVTWTVNSSGLSFNAAGYGGTTTAITGAASITKNSAGFQFNGAALAGTTSGFTGANISASITHNTAGLAMSMSVAAPGAAAEANAINLLGANTAGNTTATGSTIGWSGVNLTLSGTNASQVVISAPATSSLSATGLLSISTNGSTISIGVPNTLISYFEPCVKGVSQTNALANGTVYVQPFVAEEPFSMYRLQMLQQVSSISATTFSISGSVSAGNASSGSGSYGQTGTVALWSRVSSGTNASSSNLVSFYSNSYSFTLGMSNSVSWSTNASSATVSFTTQVNMGFISSIDSTGGRTVGTFSSTGSTTFSSTSTNANSFSSSFVNSVASALVSGPRPLIVPFVTSLSQGEYWLAHNMTTNTGSTNYSNQRNLLLSNSGIQNYSTGTLPYAEIGFTASNASSNIQAGWGSYSASSQTTTSIPITQISHMSNLQTWFNAMAAIK